MSDEEIKSVWSELEIDSTAPRRALQLILLTGQRPGEVVGIPLEELNLNETLWTLSGNRTKNGLTNLVPLSNQAVRVTERQRVALEEQMMKRIARKESAPKSIRRH